MSIFEKKSNESYFIEILYTEFVCVPIKNQVIKTVQWYYECLKDTELGDSGNSNETVILVRSDFYCPIVLGEAKLSKLKLNSEDGSIEIA